MDSLDLYKFINNTKPEWHWERKNPESEEVDDVILFIPTWDIKEFNNLLPKGIFDDDGVECRMKNGYFAFWMEDICSYCGIELRDIFHEVPA